MFKRKQKAFEVGFMALQIGAIKAYSYRTFKTIGSKKEVVSAISVYPCIVYFSVLKKGLVQAISESSIYPHFFTFLAEEKPAAMQHESPSLQSSASSSNSGSSSSETAAASSQAEVKSSIESASIASRTTTTAILSWIILLFINM